MKIKKETVKYLIGLATVVALRLLPHPPNVEPIMATMMPFAKKWGQISGFAFAVAAVLGFDLLTGTLGTWSLITASTYGLIGVAAGVYLNNKENKTRHYLLFAFVATIIYDAITGVVMGTLLFHMPLWVTITGQIPFTLYHLAGNIALAAVLSPLLFKWVVNNRKMETGYLWNSIVLGVK
ncbi:hypothetical protein CO057_02635 [Candidatus Uhrbacteria bacterium CG_4_9_14_0_2_um_filter_41_50]|uniref:Rod shape-determining protein MreD n=1 Tax=Candidatus Uhrbacteria bacterium CG_4_9_14_0_2_um_filter_41_50 TaxID=1975031 RepID=A0A2M8EP07_9BACT|nr:MAG: hypothetical protein COZ45_00270 [Candidatus Uhrbacteria bacterium CG_4_10_14_3_um_filter_41_21]PIZ55341.1 MAG: hypothetical protein COY24_00740 [Candidatus Uhrbacteria bacterium CG_4_10_14_0_2_um_filter_41_21]PJB84564.1 MAG: hypothetical protein CO086_02915 [Candidatus Uhrbacteria bacterium CG_4_9_14_0_8_um_filter_41_16]PJC24468.1 MAG: hypothetical protein CO057_02635 [Candidatus Uhrbacteria bacterium CG_4_9_14_0_2_um_filter_41_50]PJE75418.1 MAG: hypothetical protein COV03_00210 [Candi